MPDRKKVIEILIIILGAAYILYRVFTLRADMHPTAGPARGVSVEMARIREITRKAQEADKAAENGSGSARDIFEKPDKSGREKADAAAPSGAQNGALSLEGTFRARDKYVAIISGKVVAEGGQVGGGKVIRIEPGRVVILKNGSEIEIRRGALNENKK